MKKLITLVFTLAVTLAFRNTASASCDTVANLTQRDTLTYYLNFANQGGGYLSGNNGYGDLEKAEELSGPIGGQLTGAFIGFGYANIISTDSSTPVTINAYDATGSGGSPGATIATTTATLGQIALSVGTSGLYVQFATPAILAANKFFISVVLPTTGDTIVVLTTTFFSLDGNGWERWSDNSWNAYNVTYGTYPYFFGNDIAAVVCGGGPLAAYQSTLSNTCGDSLSVQFYNTSSNGVDSIKWNFQGGTPDTSTAQTPSVSYSGTGTYNVQLIAFGAGASDTTNSFVELSPAVTATTSTTPASSASATDGTATVVGLTGAAPLTFSWNDANQDTTEKITQLAAGTYDVTVYSATGCYVIDSAVVTYINNVVSIGANKQVKIYPNPTTDNLYMDWNTATTAEIRICDMTGRVVTQFITENSTNNIFNIHGLSAGSYIITITDRSTNESESVKFIKM